MKIQSTLSTWVNELLLANTLDLTDNSLRSREICDAVRDLLRQFATAPDFEAKMRVAFGKEIDVTEIKSAWEAGDFSALPSVEVRPARDINGANGAFSADTNRIYLAQEFLQQYLLPETESSLLTVTETESLSATAKFLSLRATAKQSPTPEALETKSLTAIAPQVLHSEVLPTESLPAIAPQVPNSEALPTESSSLPATAKQSPTPEASETESGLVIAPQVPHSEASPTESSSLPATGKQSPNNEVVRVLLEEVGHWVDTQVHAADGKGDEGAIFAALVSGDGLSEGQLQVLREEDDLAVVNLDGQLVGIEMSETPNPDWQPAKLKSEKVEAFVKAFDYSEIWGEIKKKEFAIRIWQYGDNAEIDSNKETIVLIHGWLGPGKSANDFKDPSKHTTIITNPDGTITVKPGINELASNLALNTSQQILFLDWASAAEENTGLSGLLPPNKAAGRIIPVAEWAANELSGINQKITLIGNSLGPYVAGEIGRILKERGKNVELIALDPALGESNYDLNLLNNTPDPISDFKEVANKSLALVVIDEKEFIDVVITGGVGAAGDNNQAGTADTSFVVKFDGLSGLLKAPEAHGAVIYTYNDLLRYLDPSSYSYDSLLASFPKDQYDNSGNPKTGLSKGHEGIFHVRKEGNTWKIYNIEGADNKDVYFIDNTDELGQLYDDAKGTDTVISRISINSLNSTIENLILVRGSENLQGIGNFKGNAIYGNSGNNELKGLAGNDILYGGLGNDTLDGGTEFDAAIFDDIYDNYKFTTIDNNTVRVSHKITNEVDNLIGIEELKFSDATALFTQGSVQRSNLIDINNILQNLDTQLAKFDNLSGFLNSNSKPTIASSVNSIQPLSALSTLATDQTLTTSSSSFTIPLLGNNVFDNSQFQWIGELRQKIHDLATDNLTISGLVGELNQVLSPYGLSIELVTPDTPDKLIEFNLNLDRIGSNALQITNIPLDANLGTSGLGLNIDGGINLSVDFDFGDSDNPDSTRNLTFGIKQDGDGSTSTFFQNDIDYLNLNLNANFSGFNAEGTLGPVSIDLTDTDNDSQFGLGWKIPFDGSSLTPPKLTKAELNLVVSQSYFCELIKFRKIFSAKYLEFEHPQI